MSHITLLICLPHQKKSPNSEIHLGTKVFNNGMRTCIDFLLLHILFPLPGKFSIPSLSFPNWQTPTNPKYPNLKFLRSVKYSLTFLSIISHVLIWGLIRTYDSSFYTVLWPLCTSVLLSGLLGARTHLCIFSFWYNARQKQHGTLLQLPKEEKMSINIMNSSKYINPVL